MKKFLLFSFSFLSLAAPQTANGQIPNSNDLVDDQGLKVVDSREEDVFALWLTARRALDATITIDATLDNMVTDPKLPQTFDISDKVDCLRPYALVRGQRYRTDKSWKYTFRYDSQIGHRGGKPDQTIYALPYRENHRIGQTYGGTVSHNVGGQHEFAIDFVMPIGTTVYAARGGKVIAVRSNSNSGGADKDRFSKAANYIIIRHDDGTYGIYAHLKQNGALVSLGQQVTTGAAIGLSGLTGYTDGPHLHFEVYVPLDGKTTRSFPVSFRTSSGVQTLLQKGESYSN